MKNLPDIAEHMHTSLMLDAAKRGDLELAESYGLKLPQADLKVFHLFGPGFCIRELHIPAGTFLIGHAHKQALANELLKGEMLVQSEGRWSKMLAPLFFVGVPGRKAAIALSDSIWRNVLATDETDPEVIESFFVQHSEEFKNHHHPKLQGESLCLLQP